MPSRRTLLRTCGVSLGFGLAGCLGTGGQSSDGTNADDTTATTATETSPASSDTTDPEATISARSSPPTVEQADPATVADRGVPVSPTVDSTDSKPFRAFTIGDRGDVANPDDNLPHQIWVWNDTNEEREIAVALTAGEATVLDETREFPARAALAIELADPRPYELTVEIPRSQFDCNDSATDVIVRSDEISDATTTTELACETATASGS
jgi:hypothetical protein